jgi:MFS family permease
VTGTEPATPGGDGGYVLLLTAIGAFFATMIARIVISPVVPAIIDAFSATRGTVGLALTGMWAGYALMQFASGILGAKYGERPVMIASVGLTGLSSAALALSPSYPTFAVMAVVLGASAGLYFSASTALLTRRYENIGQVLGLHSTGGPLAGLVGPLAAVAVAGVWGWRAALAVGAAVAIPVAAFLSWRIEPTPPTAGDRPLRSQLDVGELLGILRRRAIAFTVVIAVSVYFVWQSLYSFYPTFLAQHWGYPSGLSSLLFAGVFAGTAVSLPVVGRLSDSYGRDRLLGAAFLSLAGGLAMLVVGDRLAVAVLGSALVAVGMGFPGVLNSRFMDIFGRLERGKGFGLVRSVNLFLGSAGSVVTGLLADAYGWAAAFGLLIAVLVVPIAMLAANQLLGADA